MGRQLGELSPTITIQFTAATATAASTVLPGILSVQQSRVRPTGGIPLRYATSYPQLLPPRTL
jgi:hypothetical protein